MYNEIASVYHLVYRDWDKAIVEQSSALHEVSADLLGQNPARVLDISCGIGTQALGFAALGCSVAASDLSEGAVARARREAAARGLTLNFSVADMRECYEAHGSGFDLVLSADNSIPHLDGSGEVKKALASMYDCLRPGGVALVGVRDYHPDEARSRGQVFNYGTRDFEGERYVVFQTRDWEADMYEVGMYFVQEESDTSPAQVICGRSRYYAIAVEHLLALMREVGFDDVQRLDGVVHNVLVVGMRN